MAAEDIKYSIGSPVEVEGDVEENCEAEEMQWQILRFPVLRCVLRCEGKRWFSSFVTLIIRFSTRPAAKKVQFVGQSAAFAGAYRGLAAYVCERSNDKANTSFLKISCSTSRHTGVSTHRESSQVDSATRTVARSSAFSSRL